MNDDLRQYATRRELVILDGPETVGKAWVLAVLEKRRQAAQAKVPLPMLKESVIGQPRAAGARQGLRGGPRHARKDLRQMMQGKSKPAPGEQPLTVRDGRWCGRPWDLGGDEPGHQAVDAVLERENAVSETSDAPRAIKNAGPVTKGVDNPPGRQPGEGE
jgi:hypothetical protein